VEVMVSFYLCRVQERSLSEQRGHTELEDAGKLPVSETFNRASSLEFECGCCHCLQ